jgi:flagellar basal-body rod protein FlgC
MKVSALRISASALDAERSRMEAISENLANVQTTRGVDGKPYRRKQVVFQTIAEGSESGGVRVSRKIESDADPIMVNMPGHPDADKDGNVAMPNINPIEEMVDMMAASRAYEANVGAITAEKSMVSKALELGR